MTLLDLIRYLHAEGRPVLDYDLYICDNSALNMEDVVDQTPGYSAATVLLSPGLPPKYIELGGTPRYLRVESLADYRRLTHATGTANRLPKRFPRLLVALFSDQSDGIGFLPRYRGKLWREIPPVELRCLMQDDLLTPVLDAEGKLTDLAYDNELAFMEPANYYFVRSEWGSDFAWQGDLARDPLPDGLTLVG